MLLRSVAAHAGQSENFVLLRCSQGTPGPLQRARNSCFLLLVVELHSLLETQGSAAWSRQREKIERLNIQAHQNVASHSDEFVKEALISHDKIAVLCHELLVVEVWRERVLPLLDAAVYESTVGSTALYWVCYHEVSLINLLEVTLFHMESCENAGDDALLELADYCHRRLLYLNTEAAEDVKFVDRNAEEMLSRNGREEFGDKHAQLAFSAATCALTVVRYLTDYMEELPPCVMARLLAANDVPMLLIPLLDARPWVRRRRTRLPQGPGSELGAYNRPSTSSKSAMVTEVFCDGGIWREQPRDERLRLTQQDAQVWLALYNLVMAPLARQSYEWDDHRKEQLAKTRRFFNEVLFDQLPPLQELSRAVEEMQLGGRAPSDSGAGGRLVMEQIPVVRERLLKVNAGRWHELASAACVGALADSTDNRKAALAQAQAMLRNFDLLELLEETVGQHIFDGERNKGGEEGVGSPGGGDEPSSSNGAASVTSERFRPPGVTLEVRHSSGSAGDHTDEWYTYDLSVDTAKPLQEVEIADEATGNFARGVRRKLLPPLRARASEGGKPAPPLPCDGVAKVIYRDRSAVAAFSLPSQAVLNSPTEAFLDTSAASTKTCPTSLWVTMGLLATEGVAVQLKLRRAMRISAAHRDAQTGKLHLYEIAGAFVTALI